MVTIWEVTVGIVIKKLKGHTNDVISVAFSSSGKLVASGNFHYGRRLSR